MAQILILRIRQCTYRVILLAFALLLGQAGPAWSQSPPASTNPDAVRTDSGAKDDITVEEAAAAELLRTPIGNHTVADLNLDQALVRRAADRLIRTTYQNRYHVVLRDQDFVKPARTDDKASRNTESNPSPTAGLSDGNDTERRAPAPFELGWREVILFGAPGLVVIWLIGRRLVSTIRKK